MEDINRVIGRRLADLVPRGRTREQQRKWRAFLGEMGWKEQTYYEARSGRRVFRVGELIAMCRASKQPVWEFLDVASAGKTVSLGDVAKPSISTAAILELVSPAEVKSWKALIAIQDALGDLNGASMRVRFAEGQLLAAHPSLSPYEWEGKP